MQYSIQPGALILITELEGLNTMAAELEFLIDFTLVHDVLIISLNSFLHWTQTVSKETKTYHKEVFQSFAITRAKGVSNHGNRDGISENHLSELYTHLGIVRVVSEFKSV